METPPSDARSLFEAAVKAARHAPLGEVEAAFDEAAAAFEKQAQPADAAEARIEQARHLAASHDRRRLERALALLDGARGHLPDDDKKRLGHLAHVRGYALSRLGRTELAIGALQEAERCFRAAGDTAGEARALDTLGVLHERGADRERAALLLAHSHALKQAAGDDEGVAISLGNLGRLALHGGKPREAEAFFHLDLELAEKLGDRRGQGVVLTNLAECAAAQGAHEQALDYANRALALAESLELPVGIGFAHLARGEALRAGREVERAADEAGRAERAFASAGFNVGVAAANLLRARLLHQEGQLRGAAAMAIASARAASRTTHDETAIDAWLEAHDILCELDRHRLARSCLQRAQDLAHRSGHQALQDRVRKRQVGEAVTLAGRRAELVVHLVEATEALAGRGDERARFRVDGFLGEGAQATVLRVTELESGKPFALKRLRVGKDRLPSLSTRMAREFAALARVEPSPHIVRAHGFGLEAGLPCLVLDLVGTDQRHASMADLMEDLGRVPPLLAVALARDAARGLVALHRAGVVHRDVKPGNLLLDAHGFGVLTDCGLAYDAHDDLYVPESSFVGSLAYAAPEALPIHSDWQKPSPKVDVYALGVLLYKSLTGAWPTPMEGTLLDVARGKLEGEADLTRIPYPVRATREILGDMLAKDADNRPDAAAVLALLESVPL